MLKLTSILALFLTLGLAAGNTNDASVPATSTNLRSASTATTTMLHSTTTKSAAGGDDSNDNNKNNTAVDIAPTGKSRGKITIQHVIQNAQDFNGVLVMEALQEAYSNVYNADYKIAWYTIESEEFTPENDNTLTSRLFAPVQAPVSYSYAQYYYYGWDCRLCPDDDDFMMNTFADPFKLITAETLLCNRLRFSGNFAFHNAANCKIEPIRNSDNEDEEDEEEEDMLTEDNEEQEDGADNTLLDDPADNEADDGELIVAKK